jgi:PAS domain S-box-containing protein
MFFALFICVKFIFIFFFRAAYEPDFIFALTPFHILSGLNNLQLLFLSSMVVIVDAYLHFKITRKKLLYSFLPTIILLSGLGLKIITAEFTLLNIPSYLIFGCLLLILLLDHQHTLEIPDVKQRFEEDKIKIQKPLIERQPQLKKTYTSNVSTPSRFSFPLLDPLFSLFKYPKERKERYQELSLDEKSQISKKIPVWESKERGNKKESKKIFTPEEQFVIREQSKEQQQFDPSISKEVEEKRERLIRLENEIEHRRRNLVEQERLFREWLHFSMEKHKPKNKVETKNNRKDPEESVDLNALEECTAILQRGVIKDINQVFADLLAYKADQLRGKNLFTLVAPESLNHLKTYYLDRLKGDFSSSYDAIFLNKNQDKIPVQVIIKPTTFNGRRAETFTFKKIGNQIQN